MEQLSSMVPHRSGSSRISDQAQTGRPHYVPSLMVLTFTQLLSQEFLWHALQTSSEDLHCLLQEQKELAGQPGGSSSRTELLHLRWCGSPMTTSSHNCTSLKVYSNLIRILDQKVQAVCESPEFLGLYTPLSLLQRQISNEIFLYNL